MPWLPAYLSPTQLAAIREKEDRYVRFLTALLTRGGVEGTLVIDDVTIVVFALIGMTGWTHRWLRSRGELTPDEVADHLIDFVLTGLATGPRPRA
jgi:hypothetical protein